MLTVTREQKDGVTRVILSGIIDESSDLVKQIGSSGGRMEIICTEIVGINSLGVKAWIDFFSVLAARRVPFSFSQCPPPIVEQLNNITNFSCGGAVTSVLAHFTCQKCNHEARVLVRSENLKKMGYNLP